MTLKNTQQETLQLTKEQTTMGAWRCSATSMKSRSGGRSP